MKQNHQAIFKKLRLLKDYMNNLPTQEMEVLCAAIDANATLSQ